MGQGGRGDFVKSERGHLRSDGTGGQAVLDSGSWAGLIIRISNGRSVRLTPTQSLSSRYSATIPIASTADVASPGATFDSQGRPWPVPCLFRS